MARFVFFNDPHFSRQPPECRADSYAEEILSKMHECAAIARKIKADAIGCSGDWFHRKGRVTFSEANDLLTLLNSWHVQGLGVIGILGNHDISGHSLDSMDNRAVGTMVRSNALQLLDQEPFVVDDKNGPCIVTGTSYFHGCDSNDKSRIRMYGADREEGVFHIHVAHGTLVRREFFEEFTRMEDLVELLHENECLPDVIVCGHLHYSEGIQKFKAPDGRVITICRTGSLGRVASDDLDRQVEALVLAVKNGRVSAKTVPIGKPPVGTVREKGGDPTPREEREERIKDFVRILREEADERSLMDHRTLLDRLGAKMELDKEVIDLAAEAVEARQ